MRILNTLLSLVLVASLAACADTGPKQLDGGVLGGAGGGFLCSHFGRGSGNLAATAGCAVIGAFLGSEVGKSLDRSDQTYAMQAQQRAVVLAPVGQQIQWASPSNPGVYGYTVAGPVQPVQSGYCREYQTTVVVGGETKNAYGRACQGPDGQWRIAD